MLCVCAVCTRHTTKIGIYTTNAPNTFRCESKRITNACIHFQFHFKLKYKRRSLMINWWKKSTNSIHTDDIASCNWYSILSVHVIGVSIMIENLKSDNKFEWHFNCCSYTDAAEYSNIHLLLPNGIDFIISSRIKQNENSFPSIRFFLLLLYNSDQVEHASYSHYPSG